MTTKTDWSAALASWVAAERERLGGPPTPDEVAAYVSGDLAPEDAARVRALLVYYPELTPLLNERPRRSFRRFLPVAAMLAFVSVTALAVEWRSENARLRRELLEPYVHEARHELVVSRARGPGGARPYELPRGERRYLLAPTLSDDAFHADYRLDLVEGSRVVWSVAGVEPMGNAFEISIPRGRLHAASYRIDVYGLTNGEARLLESFPFRVPPDL